MYALNHPGPRPAVRQPRRLARGAAQREDTAVRGPDARAGFFGRLLGDEPRPSADEVLERQSERKEQLNEQFRDVLRRVGSPGYQRPWSLFG